ncbi:MAG: efflux RND transporter periplasmic adaptor subunit [Roseibacillus sp.]
MKPILKRSLQLLRKTGSLLFPLIILAVFLAGWWIGRPSSTDMSSSTMASGDPDTIWTCSMHPTIRQPNPGPCPICQMDLIPVSASGAGGLRELSLSNSAVANMGLRVAPVVRQPLEKSLSLLGKVMADESSLTTTTARFGGRLDKLYIDYTGATVLKGQSIAEVYSPDLLVAQQELISAKRRLTSTPGRTSEALYRGAREKLRLLELSPEQIDAIEQQSGPRDRIVMTAPFDGVVMHLGKREGDYLKTGDALYTLADLSVVWVQLEAYEDDLVWLKDKQRVQLQSASLPGQTFEGEISFIDPTLDMTRRVVRVRVAVPNPLRELKPGMFITASVEAQGAEMAADPPLQIPASAVLRTGKRAVVYRRIPSDEGVRFEGREIVLGPRANDFYVVLSGVEEGDLVATRGAFKLDSELQIQAKPAMMLDGQSTGEGPALQAPVTVSGAWKPVLRSLARAEEARDRPREFVEHLAGAKMILEDINPDILDDAYEPLWDEAKMKLVNLLVQTSTLAKEKSVASAWQLLVRELPISAAQAGLPWQLPSLLTLPQSEIKQINLTVETLLTVSDSLAHDKPAQALASAPKLAEDLRKLGPDFEAVADEVAAAKEEEALREALKGSITLVTDLIREGASDQLGSLYLVHCPMASDNEGADWLSREPIVENPYLGSSMFSCGDVTETLSLTLETLNGRDQ